MKTKLRIKPFRLLLGVLVLVGLLRLRRRSSYHGKVVVITGGSRGLGLALAKSLAREGAILHLLARNQAELDRAATTIRSMGATVTPWCCDVRDKGQVEQTLGAIGQESGGIDLLINNAGIIVVSPLENLTEEDFGNAMNIHFWAPLLVTNAALPFLRKCQGHVVNISSIGGRIAVPHLAAYSASKFALVGLSDALRNELKKDGIRVTTVCPGLMRTGSHGRAEFKGDHNAEFTWFSLGATLPFCSVSSDRAAREILAAARAGKADLTLSVQARLAVIAQALAPNTTAFLLGWIGRLLPSGSSKEVKKGEECHSRLSPSFLTKLGDNAAIRLNEKPAESSTETKSQGQPAT